MPRLIEKLHDLVVQALSGGLDAWQESARSCLALVLVLDQFPRNIYRGSSKAFAGDERARQLSELAVNRSYDDRLSFSERCFLYRV
ncbi:MAG: DUF924 domain-containing protein [Deltaproteobacteria bacterium]|nr:DUF924 domain-containing protein [Deltaproteobacteria bacterium]